jgi:hypothetical protein
MESLSARDNCLLELVNLAVRKWTAYDKRRFRICLIGSYKPFDAGECGSIVGK